MALDFGKRERIADRDEALLLAESVAKPPKARHRLVRCDGEAHGNAFIDHCMECAPRWGWVEIPETYSTVAEYRNREET